jgi:hypothetical protein
MARLRARVGLSVALVGLSVAACQTPPKVAKREPVAAPSRAPAAPSLDPTLGLLVRVGELKLQLPKDWQPDPSRPDAWEEPQTSAGLKHGASFHAIVAQPKGPSVPWEEHWRGLSQEYQDRTSRVQRLLAEGPLDLGLEGASGWFFLSERSEEGATFRIYQAVIGTPRDTVYLTWAVRAEGWERWGETFTRCARSARASY